MIFCILSFKKTSNPNKDNLNKLNSQEQLFPDSLAVPKKNITFATAFLPSGSHIPRDKQKTLRIGSVAQLDRATAF